MMPAHVFLNLPPDRIAPEAEEEFFTSIKLRNGTYKTTSRRRFADINHELRNLIESGAINVEHVMDIGISSGSNTVELYQEIGFAGRKSRIIATDLMPEACLVKVFPGCFALTDSTGYPLRYDISRWSISPWVVGSDYRKGFFIVRKAINMVLGWRARKVLAGPASARVQNVELVTPVLRRHADIAVRKDDITQYNHAFDGKFSFIRAANILNNAYFSDVALMAIVDNIRRYLATPRAALLVLRTHADGANHGTLFGVEQGGGCDIIQRFGRGSEVEDIVLKVMRRS